MNNFLYKFPFLHRIFLFCDNGTISPYHQNVYLHLSDFNNGHTYLLVLSETCEAYRVTLRTFMI